MEVKLSKTGDVESFAIPTKKLEENVGEFRVIKKDPSKLESLGNLLANKNQAVMSSKFQTEEDLLKFNKSLRGYAIVDSIFNASKNISPPEAKDTFIKHAISGVLADKAGNMAADLDKNGELTNTEYEEFMKMQ